MAGRSGKAASTIEAGGLRALLYRSARRTLSLQLRRDRVLIMRAPFNAPEPLLRDFLARRRPWVERHQARFDSISNQSKVLHWQDGERLPYFGRELELRVERGKAGRARLEHGAVIACVQDPADAGLVRRAVERLYAREAARRFPPLLDECLDHPAAAGLPRPRLRFRSMRSRWGSCDTARRVVTLNTNLVRQKPEIVRYVIMHELAHLRYRSHDEEFYGFLAKLCPDWQRLRSLLAEICPE